MKQGVIVGIIVTLGALLLFGQLPSNVSVEANELSSHSVATSPSSRKSFGKVPAFKATAHTGEELSAQTLSSGPHLLAFFFTSCQGVCPTLLGNVKEFVESLSEQDQPRVIAFTVDPENDTLEKLRSYHAARGFPATWKLARMDRDSLAALMESVHLAIGDEPATHSTRVIAVDGDGIIVGYARGLDKDTFPALVPLVG